MQLTRWMLAAVCVLFAGLAGCGAVSDGGSRAGGGGTVGASGQGAAATASSGSAAAAGTPAPGGSAGGGVAAAGAGASVPVLAGTVSKTDLPAVTLHLAGDSTVMTYAEPSKQRGWGQELGQFFNDQVTINNQAIGGASVKSFKSGNWNKIIAVLKAGDYVMMQFGANDSGTVPGRHVEPADFAATLGQMADEVKAKGATPIFVTPSAFFQWSGEKQDNARLAPYAEAAYTAGKAKGVLVDDLNARGVEYLNAIGQTAAKPLYFPSGTTVDKAHFLQAGSTKMAQFVAEELRRINSPLAAYLK
jgi:DNA sulfur modification protein DndE